MIELLALTNLTVWLAIGVVVVVGAQMVFLKRFLKGINSDVGDSRNPLPSTLAAESNEGNGFRTSVATPRPRKLQPPATTRRADEESSPATDAPVLADTLAASKSTAPVKPDIVPVKETELAEPVLAAAAVAPHSGDARKDNPAVGETSVPPGALVLGTLAPGAVTPVAAKAASSIPAPKADVPVTPILPATTLPPLVPFASTVSLPKPSVMPDEIPVATRKFFAPAAPVGSLTASANPPPDALATKDPEKNALPLLSSVVPAPAADEKLASGPEGIVSSTALPTGSLPILDAPAGLTLLKAADSKASAEPPVPAADADDVKKKAPRPPAPEPAVSAGLILMPPAPAESKPEPVTAKAPEVSTDAKSEAKPVAEKTAEPVLSPAVADEVPAAVKPEAETKPEAEAKALKGPRVFLPSRFFGGKSKDKESTAKAAEPVRTLEAVKEPAILAKVESEVPKITEPASAPALAVPPIEEAVPVPKIEPTPEPVAKLEDKPSEAVTAKADDKPADDKRPEPVASEETKPEPLAVHTPEASAGKAELVQKSGGTAETEPKATRNTTLEAKAPEEPEPRSEAVPEPKTVEPVAPVAPVSPAGESSEKTAVESTPDLQISSEKKSTPPALPEHALVASASEKPAESTPPTQAGPTIEPIAEPLTAVFTPAVAKPEEAVAAPAPKAEPAAEKPVPVPFISKPQPVMPPTDTNTSLPNSGRASAQLTLAFEVTSLQLTPFFKLGSVQLKALSNVVSLHLVAAQADNPLAAGISFQIEHVDLDGSSHIKSILLKPLGESRSITAPLPKLQVDNVAVTGGGESAPISVTTSDQASTAVQLFGTFTIAAMDFTPAFEIGSLRLEPNSNTVLLRVAPSSRPTALDLPPSFEIAAVQLGDGAQITGVRVTPSTAKAS